MKINLSGDYVLVACPNPSIDIYAWIDEFNNGTTNRLVREERYPGGKGLHVAMALAELDIEVVLAGFWGGLAGEWIKTECNKYYPKIKFIGPELDQWARSCYTFRSENKFNDTELLGTGPTISKENYIDYLVAIEEYLPNAKTIVLSGSWPLGAPENANAIIIKKAGINSIPSFIDCTGNQLNHALKENPHCIHLNRSEAESFSKVAHFDEAIEAIKQNCSVAAITDGAKGLHYLTNNNRLHSLAKITNVISTIGSGDCLLAGIVAGHVKDLSDQDVADLGAACGAANCVRPELGMLYKADVEELLSSVSHSY